mmetsp:Transcript_21253/g.59095  ORF Transcript_21253/g.59095 Transcript_21253/m.59095 type:complete len:204 (+) Transcript_21253:1085-1696(+)
MDAALVHLGILEDLLHRVHALPEQVHVQLLKPGTGDGGEEVHALVQRVNLHRGLSAGREGALGTLTSSAQASHGTGVGSDVLLVLPLELLDKVVHEAVVEVLTSEVGIASSGLYLEYALLNGQQGHIEGTTSKIKDQDVALSSGGVLLVKTVSNGSSCRLIDDAQHVEASNGTGVLGGLALGVVEICGDSDDSLLHSLVITEV